MTLVIVCLCQPLVPVSLYAGVLKVGSTGCKGWVPVPASQPPRCLPRVRKNKKDQHLWQMFYNRDLGWIPDPIMPSETLTIGTAQHCQQTAACTSCDKL